MNRNKLLLKFFLCFSILACYFVSGVLPFAVADGQAASLPVRSLGDEWVFVVDYKGDEGLLCNMTTRVTETSVLSPSGKFECFELTSEGAGIVYGVNVSGTWSTAIREYYGKVDFSLAELSQNLNVNVIGASGSTTAIHNLNTVYTPPFGINNGFPLQVGKNWTAASTAAKTNTINVNGQVTQENMNVTVSMDFVVVKTEKIVTQAGEFETYVLLGTVADGSVQKIYYAPAVGMQVKEVDYDKFGFVTATMELMSFKVDASSGSLSIYWIALAIIGVAVVVSAVSIGVLRGRNR